MTGFKFHQQDIGIYVAVTISSEGEFRQTMSPSATYFCPALDPSLGWNHYRNVSFLSISISPFSRLLQHAEDTEDTFSN